MSGAISRALLRAGRMADDEGRPRLARALCVAAVLVSAPAACAAVVWFAATDRR